MRSSVRIEKEWSEAVLLGSQFSNLTLHFDFFFFHSERNYNREAASFSQRIANSYYINLNCHCHDSPIDRLCMDLVAKISREFQFER